MTAGVVVRFCPGFMKGKTMNETQAYGVVIEGWNDYNKVRPEIGVNVLVTVKGSRTVRMAFRAVGGWYTYTRNGIVHYPKDIVTHWMESPKTPTQ